LQSRRYTVFSRGGRGLNLTVPELHAERSPIADRGSTRLIQAWERRYRFVLLAVALILLADQALLQPLLARLNGFAPAINLAGRQRMLSQKITKSALALHVASDDSTDDHRAELQSALADWERVHQALSTGDVDLQLPPAEQPAIVAALAELEPPFSNLRSAARLALTQDHPESTAASVTMLATEGEYLRRMDHIVSLYEHEAERQVTRLRILGACASAMILGLLAALGRFVLRPAVDHVQEQMDALTNTGDELRAARDRLEERVRERTGELTAANESLKHEVRERRRAEETSRRLQAELAHAARVRSLGQLATGLAHEINQPLSAIASFADAADLELESGIDQYAARKSILRIRETALRAGKIVRRMRAFLRPTQHSPTSVSLCTLIDDVVELCRPELRREGIAIEWEVPADIDAAAQVDAIQIQQVLVNLIQNAMQSMRSRPADRHCLGLSLEQVGDQLVIHVDDTGGGFETDRLINVPRPFHTAKEDGLGMGLSICRSILAAHGGQLRLANRRPGGARVSILLPAASTPTEPGDAQPSDALADCVCR
jgi:two-component system sensor kinase FixL